MQRHGTEPARLLLIVLVSGWPENCSTAARSPALPCPIESGDRVRPVPARLVRWFHGVIIPHY
mgnify:CR=1 FL=1